MKEEGGVWLVREVGGVWLVREEGGVTLQYQPCFG